MTKKASASAEVKILENGKVMKIQRSRQRRVLSCINCHSKKIKCSRVQPVCNNCEKLNIECKYFINERVSRGGKRREKDAAVDLSASLSQDSVQCADGTFLNSNSLRNSSISSYSDNGSSSPKSRNSTDDTSACNDEAMGVKRGIVNIPIGLNFEQPAPSNASESAMSLPRDIEKEVNECNVPYKVKKAMEGFLGSSNGTPSMNTPIVSNMSGHFGNTNYSNDDQFQFNLSSFSFNPEHLIIASERSSPLHQIRSYKDKNVKKEDDMLPSMVPFPAKSGVKHPMSASSSTVQNYGINSPFTRDNQSSLSPRRTTHRDSDSTSHGVVDDITHLKRDSEMQPENPGLYNSLNAYSSNPAATFNYLYGTNVYFDNDHLLDDLVQYIPASRERSYELISRYINSVHVLLPVIVNLNDFIAEHDEFWKCVSLRHEVFSTSSNEEHPKVNSDTDFNYLQFYTLYFPVLYAATISEFEEYDNLLLNQDIDKYLKAFVKICQYYNYPQGLKSIPLLLGNVIIQLTSPNPSTMEMAQILRYAKLLQLHKDPVLSLRISDWEVIKFRRLLWWVIFGLDALTSHNFCLPPICKFDDFNVLMPEEDEPIFGENGQLKEKKLNVSILAMKIKFKYDRILSELVYQINNGLSTNITPEQISEIKCMIVQLYNHVHIMLDKMTVFYHKNPPQTVQEVNIINFIKNHSWSYVDRATMLLHKKILLRDTGFANKGDAYTNKSDQRQNEDNSLVSQSEYRASTIKNRGGVLSLSQYEDTFGRIEEANIVANLNNSSISQLKFNEHANFSYENLSNNLIPSILHNLNDFLKYNDFIKFGKFNWFVKRTIPLDSIILMFIIIIVKFKYEFLNINELMVYVKLINKSLFILNRKYFKNEKYKRMLSLTNLVWKFILERFKIVLIISHYSCVQNNADPTKFKIEFFDYQVAEYMNMNELFDTMNVPKPLPPQGQNTSGSKENSDIKESNQKIFGKGIFESSMVMKEQSMPPESRTGFSQIGDNQNHIDHAELMQLSEKIYYDLRNNFVDINDYCPFYSSLENILQQIMNYILS